MAFAIHISLFGSDLGESILFVPVPEVHQNGGILAKHK